MLRPGFIFMFSGQRANKVSLYELQAYGFYIPFKDENITGNYYALIRLKRRSSFLDIPWLFDWSSLSLKTNSDEKLDARALVETGLGGWFFDNKTHSLALESGLVFDYANLQAYLQNISAGYLKTALLYTWFADDYSGKFNLQYFHELVNSDETRYARQSRIEFEGNISYHFTENLYITMGTILVRYSNISEFFQKIFAEKLADKSISYYLVATYHHR